MSDDIKRDAPAQREKGWYAVKMPPDSRPPDVHELGDGWYLAHLANPQDQFWDKGPWFGCCPLFAEIGPRILPPTTPANPEPDEATVERVASHDYIIDQARYWLSRIDTRDPDLHRLWRERNMVVTSLDEGDGAFRPDGTVKDPDDMDDAWLAEIIATVRNEAAATAREAGRDETIRELREPTPRLAHLITSNIPNHEVSDFARVGNAKLALKSVADYLAANRPSPASREG